MLERLAVAAQGAHPNVRRRAAACRRYPARDRHPSSPGAAALGREDLGVDEHQRLIARFAQIEHQQALVHVHLGGRKPDALGRIHGLEHVVRQATHRVIDDGDGLGLLPQSRVRILQNYELCHGSNESDIVFLAEDSC